MCVGVCGLRMCERERESERIRDRENEHTEHTTCKSFCLETRSAVVLCYQTTLWREAFRRERRVSVDVFNFIVLWWSLWNLQ